MQSPVKWGLSFAVLIAYQVFDVLGKYTCGKTLYTSTSGSIWTPNYYRPVNATISCSYEIAVSGRWVQLGWNGFDVNSMMPECYNNYVSVSIGCGAKETELSRFCSTNADKPHEIYAKDGCIKIKYRESTFGKKGFHVSYRSYSMRTPKSTSRCSSDRNMYSNQGVVVSPGWPTGYKPSYFPIFGSDCEWDLKVGSKFLFFLFFALFFDV